MANTTTANRPATRTTTTLQRATATVGVVFLLVGGVIYLVLWIYGLVIDRMSSANFVPVNTADNWLHLILGLGMIALGLAFGRDARRASATARS
jgi:hypothetical protein